MALPEDARGYARYWGAALAAVRDRVDTRGFWDALREAAEASDTSLPPGGFSAVTALRSAAVRVRESERLLAQAENADALSAQFAPTAIWSRDPETMEMFPKWQATVDITTLDPNGNESTRSLSITNLQPNLYTNVGELRDAIQQGVESLVSSYGYGTLLDVGNPSVVAY